MFGCQKWNEVVQQQPIRHRIPSIHFSASFFLKLPSVEEEKRISVLFFLCVFLLRCNPTLFWMDYYVFIGGHIQGFGMVKRTKTKMPKTKTKVRATRTKVGERI